MEGVEGECLLALHLSQLGLSDPLLDEWVELNFPARGEGVGSKSKVRPQEQGITIALDLSVQPSGKLMKPQPFRDCTPGGAVDLCSGLLAPKPLLEMLGAPAWEQDPPEGGALPP